MPRNSDDKRRSFDILSPQHLKASLYAKKRSFFLLEGGKGGQGALTRWQSLICRSMRWHTRLSSPSSSPLFPVACADARWSWKMLILLGWFPSFLSLIAGLAACPVNCVWGRKYVLRFCFCCFFFIQGWKYGFSCNICRRPQSCCCWSLKRFFDALNWGLRRL